MRKWSKIIALLLVLAVLAAAYFLLKGGQSGGTVTPGGQTSPTPSANPDTVNLISLQHDNMTKIAIKHSSGEILLDGEMKEVDADLVQADGTVAKVKQMQLVWSSKQFPVDTAMVDLVAYAADNLTSKRLIEENPANLSDYGLDNPISITITGKDGKEETVLIGSSTPTKDSYYVQKAGNKAVYTIDFVKASNLIVTKLDLYSKTFYDRTDLTVDDMTALSVSRDGEKFFDSHLVEMPATWKLTYPTEIAADYPDLNRFFEGLLAMTATKVVAENPSDLKLYGLESPKYVFDYTLAGKAYSLKIGMVNETLYGKYEGDARVFTFDPKMINAAEMPLVDVVELLVYVPSIFDTEKLVIEIDGRTDVLQMNATQDANDTDEFIFNGKKIEGDDNQSLFRRYYQGAIAFMGDNLDLDAKPEGQAFVRLTYTMKDGVAGDKTVIIELIPTKDDYGYYITKNGEYTGLVMGKRQLDKEDMGIRTAYQNLINGLK